MSAGKGNRKHRNVSNKAFRDGFDYWKRNEAKKPFLDTKGFKKCIESNLKASRS